MRGCGRQPAMDERSGTPKSRNWLHHAYYKNRVVAMTAIAKGRAIKSGALRPGRGMLIVDGVNMGYHESESELKTAFEASCADEHGMKASVFVGSTDTVPQLTHEELGSVIFELTQLPIEDQCGPIGKTCSLAADAVDFLTQAPERRLTHASPLAYAMKHLNADVKRLRDEADKLHAAATKLEQFMQADFDEVCRRTQQAENDMAYETRMFYYFASCDLFPHVAAMSRLPVSFVCDDEKTFTMSTEEVKVLVTFDKERANALVPDATPMENFGFYCVQLEPPTCITTEDQLARLFM